MSTIHDALKKAQAGREPQKIQAAQPQAHSDSSRPPVIEVRLERGKATGMNWGPVFVVLVLLLITGPILAPLFASPFKRASAPATAILQTQQQLAANPAPNGEAAMKQAQFAIEETPLPPVQQLPSLNLSGVVYAPNEDSYVIINDKIIKSGELVGGAKVVRISADKVTLMYQGRQVELPVAQT